LTSVISNYPWYAIKVRTSSEERVARALEGKGYELFLPTYVESRRYSDRIKKVKSALFPGYIFGRFDVNRRLPILQSEGVEHIVGIGQVAEPIADAEIQAIRAVAACGMNAEPWPYLREGDRVMVQFGGLTGVIGELVQMKGNPLHGNQRLVLSIHLLQRSISVEIDRGWVRPLDGRLAGQGSGHAQGHAHGQAKTGQSLRMAAGA
jgi:transcriptional antiterminator NusG